MRRSSIAVAVSATACVVNPRFDPPQDTESGTTADTTETSTTTASATDGDTDGPPTDLGDPCPPLPPPEGEIITVGPDQASELGAIIRNAPAGATVELLPGVYALTDGVFMDTPGVTVRSSTGNAQDVVLDGSGIDESLFLIQASDVTVGEMTLQRSGEHLIHVSGHPTGDVLGVTGYRLRLSDPTRDAFKANFANGHFADGGTLACSTIELTDAGRPSAGAECTPTGISGHGVSGWEIRDNRIEGLWCPTGDTHAIWFFAGSADHVIARNTIIDSAVGIQLGLYEVPPDGVRTVEGPPECTGAMFDHYGGTVRNNMVAAVGQGIAASDPGFISGIALWQVCGTTVVHNTVASAVGALGSVEYRFARSQQKVLNNLVTHPFRDRDGADAPSAGNVEVPDLASFVDPLGADLHLLPSAAAIDAGVQLGADAVTHDIDGEVRDDLPDVGADEA